MAGASNNHVHMDWSLHFHAGVEPPQLMARMPSLLRSSLAQAPRFFANVL